MWGMEILAAWLQTSTRSFSFRSYRLLHLRQFLDGSAQGSEFGVRVMEALRLA